MTDDDIHEVMMEDRRRAGVKKHRGKILKSEHMVDDSKPRKLNWSEERDRALAHKPGAISRVIEKVYDMAEAGNMDAAKVVLERDFGKVTTPLTIEGLAEASTEALIATRDALEGPAQ